MRGGRLVFLKDGVPLLRLPLESGQVFIGGDLTNDIALPGEAIPDFAAVLFERGKERYLLREPVQGGISRNGKPLEIEEIDLSASGSFNVGPFTIVVEPASSANLSTRNTAPMSLAGSPSTDAWIHHAGRRHPIPATRPFSIGSHETNDLVIDDGFVSAFHCRIAFNGRLRVEDLGSTNGTIIDGLRLRLGSVEVATSAVLRIGKTELSVRSEERSAIGSTLPAPRMLHGMIAESEALRSALASIDAFARQNHPVLVIGESGTGKELVARALHDRSERRSKPFLAINCGAINASLIESELFGHAKGAFTGADTQRAGAFEAASEGTLFLDEIGELPLELQPKLLRVLESSVIRRVGDTREIAVDSRIVAATHRNLEELIARGQFRDDLFHRLFVLPVRLPALRDRPEDVIQLANHFLHASAPDRAMRLSAGAEERLLAYEWPGNIRELRNVVIRAILKAEGEVVRAGDFEFRPRRIHRRREGCEGVVLQDRERGASAPPRCARAGLRESRESGRDPGRLAEHAVCPARTIRTGQAGPVIRSGVASSTRAACSCAP
jgi:two-component system, NtrC family, response regulator GlrR